MGELPLNTPYALFGYFIEGNNDFSTALCHRWKAFCSSWQVAWGLPPTSLTPLSGNTLQASHRKGKKRARERKKSTRQLLLQELYVQLAHSLVTMKRRSQYYYYHVLRKGRELLPRTAKEVYAQRKRSSSQDFRKDCISMKCFWSCSSPKSKCRLHAWEAGRPCPVVQEADAKEENRTALQPPETQGCVWESTLSPVLH